MEAQNPKHSNQSMEDRLRMLPGVDQVLKSERGGELVENYGHNLTTAGIRKVLEDKRLKITAGANEHTDLASIANDASIWLKELVSPTSKDLINATGVIIHTNLGRAPLSQSALKQAILVGGGYSNLEYDLEKGIRGSRAIHAENMLIHLTGAEAALVVNNNAAAVLLVLTAFCRGREVIISRGQLVEIGGGFRIPEVLAQSGAELVEVGTTNRTHISDYQNAITDETAAILMVHHSNYRIIGFSKEPNVSELVRIARGSDLLMLYDQGSGAMIDTTPFGLEHEQTISEAVQDGVDLVMFSGDKLLGGPQAGIICGRKELIDQLKRHPLSRALRADKLCLASLSSTLTSFLTGKVEEDIPVWQMISQPIEVIRSSASDIVESVRDAGVDVELVEGESTVGGGSLPGTTIPTWLVAIETSNADKLAEKLRWHDPPIITRIADDKVIVDPRTMLEGQKEMVIQGIISAARDI